MGVLVAALGLAVALVPCIELELAAFPPFRPGKAIFPNGNIGSDTVSDFEPIEAKLVGVRGTADRGFLRSLPMAESGETQTGAEESEAVPFWSALDDACGLRRRSRRPSVTAW